MDNEAPPFSQKKKEKIARGLDEHPLDLGELPSLIPNPVFISMPNGAAGEDRRADEEQAGAEASGFQQGVRAGYQCCPPGATVTWS